MAAVTFGADWTVESIIRLSEIWNVKTDALALTIIALGTSLPEVAVSINASRKGKGGIAVGNIIGSNIFNTFGVMSIPSFFAPLSITAIITDFSLPFMVGITAVFIAACIPGKLFRWQGIMFLGLYLTFLIVVISKTL
jgi:cation:H+ antiporter